MPFGKSCGSRKRAHEKGSSLARNTAGVVFYSVVRGATAVLKDPILTAEWIGSSVSVRAKKRRLTRLTRPAFNRRLCFDTTRL